MSFRTLNPTFLEFLEVVQKEKGAEGMGSELYDTLTKWFQPHAPKKLLKCSTQEQMLMFFFMDFLSCSNWTRLLIITTSGLHNSHPTRMHKPLCQRIWHVPKWSILLHFKSSRCLSLPIKITFWKNCSLLSSVKSTRIRIRDFSNFHWCANIFMCL